MLGKGVVEVDKLSGYWNNWMSSSGIMTDTL